MKPETLPKGVGVAKFDFTKTFRNQLFLPVRVLYHQYRITNHSESILKSKIMSILVIIFVVAFYPGIQFRLPCTPPPPGQFFMGAKLFIGTPWMGNEGVLKKNWFGLC